ncbi:phospholipase D zeta 1 [Selaginella moellendorffii]|uniref:phospholipase D zeta 1 n=1 Tax=Selaginella moellendorffii TaxID=88036 RepID=UPI000D1CE8C7|nr:phospholipase D zeta 1 [Selaginella moellendorffii]|eukprot:XP_024516571.1 phospholipase D zeta 1 [Selaginella moellendorffii]
MAENRYMPVRSPERASASDRCSVFEELPQLSIVSVCRQSSGELRYTIELVYKQFKWTVYKKATQALLLHAAVKTRAFLEDLKEKHEKIIEWIQKLQSSWDAQAHEDYEQHDATITRAHSMPRDVPSAAALPVIRPTLGRLPSIADNSISEMQTYLDHFVKNLELLNSEAVCKFFGVSALSFAPEYGSKLKEGYVRVCHLDDKEQGCFSSCFNCCGERWMKVWAVLKPGFLAFLAHPFDPKPLDIIVFDVLSNNTEGQISLAKPERSRLQSGFAVTCGNRSVRVRTKGARGAAEWIAAINDAGLRPPEGWCHPHRFGSFAPPRGLTSDGSKAQYFIDGKSAFDAIASTISSAKSEIFIADWWFCPELYLRRPFTLHESSRLDSLLGAKAREGVQIYVLLYKEVALALKINSLYTKRKLLGIHENIKVLRYPDHFSSGVYLWSHHEKIVIVDQRICFLGGLDLCFGRYDDPHHLLRDDQAVIWPGKDYYNPRESEPNSWEDATKDEINRQKTPRMPWHDIQCAIWGPACRDVARHFVQRWNYAKRNKAPNEQAIPLLLPHHHMVIPHYLTGKEAEEALMEAQEELRKASLKPRSSTDDIPTLLPAVEAPDQTEELKDLLADNSKHSKLLARFSKFNSSNSSVDLPLLNFVASDGPDGVKWYDANGSAEDWWEKDNPSPQEDVKEVGSRVKCNCQVVRSVGQWSAGTSQVEERSIEAAYCSLIDKAEHFIYIENQFFISGLDGDSVIQNRVLESLYTRILRAYKEKQCFRVIILLPLLPGFQGGVDDTGAASVRAIIHWQYRTICRGNSSLLKRLRDTMGDAVGDFVSFYGLRQHGKLKENGPLVTNQIYVHSKILIVDDRVTLIGSANINDRSLLGSRDSEIAVVIEDKEYVTSLMNNTAYKAGRFAHGLRRSLWVEHLGFQASEADVIKDPICETTYKDVWTSRAELNTGLYDTIFGCIPNDSIHTRTQLRQIISSRKEKEKNGHHVSIDLGVADDSSHAGGEAPFFSSNATMVEGIRGHLVCFPLNFMCDEDLRPVFNESEYYASPQVYH